MENPSDDENNNKVDQNQEPSSLGHLCKELPSRDSPHHVTVLRVGEGRTERLDGS